MSRLRVVGAVAFGLVLASLPFLQYGTGGGHRHSPGAHADHEPRYGGQLGMTGDHHLELVQRAEHVEVFVSDALRRPLRVTRGTVRFDDGAVVPMQWRRDRLIAPLPSERC